MKLYEKKLQRIFYVLYDETGLPKTNLTSSDIVFRYAKANDSDYAIKTLTDGQEGNFGELGYGMYWTDLTQEETDVIGNMAIVVTTLGSSPSPPSPLPQEIETKHIVCNVEPFPITPGPELPTCIIHGSVKDLGARVTGKPMAVHAQLLRLPAVIESSFIGSNVEDAYTNVQGVFELRLVIGAIVRVEIPDAGVRRQFQVPDLTTANLKDLPSP